MDVARHLNTEAIWKKNEPASDLQLRQFVERYSPVPADFLAFLAYSNGAEGGLPVDPWYIYIASTELYSGIEILKSGGLVPDNFFPFGTNGGDAIIGIDTSQNSAVCHVDMYDDIPQEPVIIAENFVEFLSIFGLEDPSL